MVSLRKVNNDFGMLGVDQPVAEAAAKAVVSNSHSTEDALLMLDVLGLIPPQPGYLPFEHEDSKAERSAKRKEEFRLKREGQREAARQRREAEMLRHGGIDDTEIGEGITVAEPWEAVVKRIVSQ